MRACQVAGIAAAGLVVCLVNAWSEDIDFARRHLHVLPVEPFVWELTSWLGLLAAIPAILAAERATARLRPAPAAAAVGLLGVGFFAVHVAAMVGLRMAIYRAYGHSYDFGPLPLGLAYEGRKDALSYAIAVGGLWLWRRAFFQRTPAAPVEPTVDAGEPAFIAESRKGRVVIRAPEIDWVEAQGNYVALHAGGQSYLIRQPLKAVGDKLRRAAFVRSHRSALVNTRRVRAIGRSPAGGLRVELANEEFAPLSDRHKAAVVKALATV